MSEIIPIAKLSIICAALVGGLISRLFLDMPAKRFIYSVLAGCAMAYYIGDFVSIWVGLQPELAGCLVGMFGNSICKLIFDSLKNSDLSFKFSDIMELIKRGS